MSGRRSASRRPTAGRRPWVRRGSQAVAALAVLVLVNLLVWGPSTGGDQRADDAVITLIQATPSPTASGPVPSPSRPAPTASPSGTPSASASGSASATSSPRASRSAGRALAAAAPAPSVRPNPVFERPSGLPWASGVFLEDAVPKHLAAYEDWLGRPVDLVQVWTQRETWAEVTQPVDHLTPWRGHRLVIGAAMFPRTGATMRACARGDYDAHWRRFGTTLRDTGFGDSVIRLGWEFNGSWYVWRASDPDTFVACWRRVVDAVRVDAPETVWDWSVNRGPSGGLDDPALAYPGDAYVDIVGVSSYDHWPAATDRSVFVDGQRDAVQGLEHWADFARSHGKLLSVPEWGNRTIGPAVGGDNPAYVRWMREFFADNADLIAYEAVFMADGGQYDEGRHLPRSAAAYRDDFGRPTAD